MNKTFLPKELDGIKKKRACAHIDIGAVATSPHWHDCVEIIYAKCGGFTVWLDSEPRAVSEGDFAIIPPTVIHHCETGDENTERAVIGFHTNLVYNSETDDTPALLPFLNKKMEKWCVIKGGESPDCDLALSSLTSTPFSDSESDIVMTYSRILALYAAILKYWRSVGALDKNGSAHPLALEAERYVREHCREPITARSTARALSISYSYMARLLTDNLGIGFSELLRSCRIDIAKEMLTATDKSITEIAYECGFCQSSAFIQSFRKMTKMTPLAYRKKHILLGLLRRKTREPSFLFSL